VRRQRPAEREVIAPQALGQEQARHGRAVASLQRRAELLEPAMYINIRNVCLFLFQRGHRICRADGTCEGALFVVVDLARRDHWRN